MTRVRLAEDVQLLNSGNNASRKALATLWQAVQDYTGDFPVSPEYSPHGVFDLVPLVNGHLGEEHTNTYTENRIQNACKENHRRHEELRAYLLGELKKDYNEFEAMALLEQLGFSFIDPCGDPWFNDDAQKKLNQLEYKYNTYDAV